MKRQYFGTDGVRGPYGGPVLTDAFAERLGFAAGKFFLAQAPGHRRVFLGRDTRASGPALLGALARGLAAAGMEPTSLDVIPTPAVALAVARHQAGPGVMVTA